MFSPLETAQLQVPVRCLLNIAFLKPRIVRFLFMCVPSPSQLIEQNQTSLAFWISTDILQGYLSGAMSPSPGMRVPPRLLSELYHENTFVLFSRRKWTLAGRPGSGTRANAEETSPGRAFFLQQVQVKEGGGQTHGQVHGRHLILFHQVHHVVEEAQEGLQGLPVLVRQQQDGCLHRLQPLFLGDI